MTMAKKIKNYQRLTHYNENTRKAVVYDYISMSPEWSPIVNRLAAFEDAIERGEILLKEEAEKLKSENAALRERLDKAVELPCKVGDKVYCIHRMSNPEMLEWQVNEIRITDHNYMLQLGRAGTKDYRSEASQFYGKWWFTELVAAEARLSELKGGK